MESHFEIGSIQALIVQGDPHLHVTFSNCETGEISTGHIEHGYEICYLVEVTIGVISGIDLQKIKDQQNPGVVAFDVGQALIELAGTKDGV